jgi:hypothetical protein
VPNCNSGETVNKIVPLQDNLKITVLFKQLDTYS